jgi:putative acetyltransferase
VSGKSQQPSREEAGGVQLRAMGAADYAAAFALWRATEGIGLSESDSEPAVAAFLRRNPGMSSVAVGEAGELLGAVLCGTDGRRGYLHHLAVPPRERGRGIGARLVSRCFEQLAAAGIPKCNVFLYTENHAGASFWEHNGWRARADLRVMQKPILPGAQVRLGT